MVLGKMRKREMALLVCQTLTNCCSWPALKGDIPEKPSQQKLAMRVSIRPRRRSKFSPSGPAGCAACRATI